VVAHQPQWSRVANRGASDGRRASFCTPAEQATGDFAVQIRMKMMTLPGEQFVIRRKAYALIKKAFDANGIKFAFPTVQVAGESEPTAAAALRSLELTQPAAAE
jgi:hypothetical protein